MKLHNHFRSWASFRARIALELKGLAYDYVAVQIAKGEHRKAPFAALSADGLVPLLEVEGEKPLRSMATIEYRDELYPAPALLPADALGRARVQALAQSIACEIHPLHHLCVLKYRARDLHVGDQDKNQWYRHWCRDGLQAFERQLARLRLLLWQHPDAGRLLSGAANFQCFASRGEFRRPAAHHACMTLPAFQKARPSACPDSQA